MNTTTRATFRDANQAHASTARGPLLRPEGIIMPMPKHRHSKAFLDACERDRQPNPKGSRTARLARMAQEQAQATFINTASPAAHCATLAVCYREALNDERARLPITPALITNARQWLNEQVSAVVRAGFCPFFLKGPQPLERAIAGFKQPRVTGELCRVPVSTDNNDHHPVWSPYENLLFRFVHDYAHFIIGAPATFEGELAVARHTLTPAVREDDALARFLASESVGQVALSIVDGTYPKQVLACGILDVI